MNFTNTDCVGEKVYWQVKWHVLDQVKKQLKIHKTWKVYLQVERMRWHLSDQITPIQIKIKRVIKK